MLPALTISGTDIKVRGRLLRVASIEGEKYRFPSDPTLVVESLKRSGRRVDLFTFLQRVSETSPKYSYPMEWDNFAVLPITTFDEWWDKIGKKSRNAARQAEKKGIKVCEIPFNETLVEGIWRIYNECPIRQGKRFPHYGMPLEKVRPYAGTFLDSSIFIGAFDGDVLIGFAKLAMDESRTQAGLMHILMSLDYLGKIPTNVLMAQAVKSCVDRHIPHLVYANFAYGNKQRDSLSDFKERNGFQRVDVPRYYVPLSPWGKLAYRMGLHRRLIEFLPEPIITRLRDYRAGWYSRKLQSTAGAN